MLEWIISRGGNWNPGLELRHDEAIPDIYGVFARENISKDDILHSLGRMNADLNGTINVATNERLF